MPASHLIPQICLISVLWLVSGASGSMEQGPLFPSHLSELAAVCCKHLLQNNNSLTKWDLVKHPVIAFAFGISSSNLQENIGFSERKSLCSLKAKAHSRNGII